VNLTPKELELASYLLSNIGQLLSRDYGTEIQTRTIDIHISRVCKKLSLIEDNGWKLTSIYHKGYRLERIDI